MGVCEAEVPEFPPHCVEQLDCYCFEIPPPEEVEPNDCIDFTVPRVYHWEQCPEAHPYCCDYYVVVEGHPEGLATCADHPLVGFHCEGPDSPPR